MSDFEYIGGFARNPFDLYQRAGSYYFENGIIGYSPFQERGGSMKKTSLAAIAVLIMAVLSAQAQMAIRWKGSAGWGQGTAYERLFNQYNLQTINGSIYRIDTLTPMRSMSMGIQFVIKTSTNEEIPVHLGPAWYILCQDMNLNLKDIVEVRGARFSLEGKNVMAAFEVRYKDKVLLLRDEDGIPYWSAWRKKKF
jgi:hypothetical protein